MSLSVPTNGKARFVRLSERLFKPVDGSSIAVFRMLFGAILVWEVWRYFSHDWIESYYTGKAMYFTYPGFSWVHPWPSPELMEFHFIVLGICAAFVTAGFLYRFAAIGLFLAFTYVFLLEEARYLNHFYLVILIAFLMVLIPANRMWSVDALIGARVSRLGAWVRSLFPNPQSLVPTWALWILRLQVGIAYVYGGIAKLTPDWLRGYPLSNWIRGADDFPILGPHMDERWMGLTLSYGGLLVDLLIVPLLLWRRTRWVGLAIAVLFNLMNAELFSIGIFPWFMMAGTLLFFEPDWPKRLWDRMTLSEHNFRLQIVKRSNECVKEDMLFKITTGKSLLAVFLIAYTAFQLLWPLRHWLYPGVVHWTEEGHMFAWHMKLRSKSGRVTFMIKEPQSGRTWKIDPEDYLDDRQTDKMAARPDMILQFAHWLRDRYESQGYEGVEVYADSWARLNGRPEQRMIDPAVNLALVEWSILPSSWILPLETPLRR